MLGGAVVSAALAFVIAKYLGFDFLHLNSLPSLYQSIINTALVMSFALVLFAGAGLLLPITFSWWMKKRKTPEKMFKKMPLQQQCIIMSFFAAGLREQKLIRDNIHVMPLVRDKVLKYSDYFNSEVSSYYLDEWYWTDLAPIAPAFLNQHVKSDELRMAIEMTERAHGARKISWMAR